MKIEQRINLKFRVKLKKKKKDWRTRRQSMHWKTPASPRMKRARMSKSQVKAIFDFLDIRGVILMEWVPGGQTINQKHYLRF
jgi:hypothetical protein